MAQLWVVHIWRFAARQLDAMAQSTGKSLKKCMNDWANHGKSQSEELFFAWRGVDPLLLIQKNMLKQITEIYAFGRGI